MKAGGIEPRETRLEKTTVKNQKNPVLGVGDSLGQYPQGYFIWSNRVGGKFCQLLLCWAGVNTGAKEADWCPGSRWHSWRPPSKDTRVEAPQLSAEARSPPQNLRLKNTGLQAQGRELSGVRSYLRKTSTLEESSKLNKKKDWCRGKTESKEKSLNADEELLQNG